MRFEKSTAFLAVITGFPVLSSISFRAFPATSQPSFATLLFSENDCGFFSFESSVVVASANILRTNSSVLILSLSFSFFNPLRFLYWRVVPRFCNFISQNCIFCTLFHAMRITFVSKFFPHLYSLKSLIYPLSAISFFQICFKGSLYGKFGVYSFINSLSTNFCKPHFKWFCFW